MVQDGILLGNIYSGQYPRKEKLKVSKVKDKRQVRSHKEYIMKKS